MSNTPEFTPSTQAYVTAFRKIEANMKETHRKMLAENYNAPCHAATAKSIGQAAGYNGFQAANLQYGHLGTMVAEEMGLDVKGVEMLAHMIGPNQLTNTEWLWIMRTNVAAALEELGWVEKRSHLFNP